MGAFASRPATHRSLNSRTATTVEFCNETCHEVEVSIRGLICQRSTIDLLHDCGLLTCPTEKR